MQDVKTTLEDLGIDKTVILRLLEQDQLLEAVRIFEQKSRLNLETTMSLLGAIKNGEEQFVFQPEANKSALKVSFENHDGIITVKLKEGSALEKVVYPNDLDWIKVKKSIGNNPHIIEYEKCFLENEIKNSKKSTLFIEESTFTKRKIVIIIAALLLLMYLIYEKF
ncbi:hypothetical protein FNJ88_10010 [Chryseobacterium sp. SNU WT5]|uniref:hypothetical protein n=1 Tax=Chryseobacterium sp. SNU WT5 TaxID=2594269 RepID=UPI00118015F4|nr:hypothetical protein [Chryseobacterium sp. SNU WT5]QDP85862.1 hypothetical protein FNJ88_10010 [Chryseobacterium sp. SNU WT5]